MIRDILNPSVPYCRHVFREGALNYVLWNYEKKLCSKTIRYPQTPQYHTAGMCSGRGFRWVLNYVFKLQKMMLQNDKGQFKPLCRGVFEKKPLAFFFHERKHLSAYFKAAYKPKFFEYRNAVFGNIFVLTRRIYKSFGKGIAPLESTSNRLWKITFWQTALVGYILPRPRSLFSRNLGRGLSNVERFSSVGHPWLPGDTSI